MSKISYGSSTAAWRDYIATLKQIVEENSPETTCEIGGGANPALPIEYVAAKQLNYTVIDISEKELEKAPSGYKIVVADIGAKSLNFSQRYDLIFTKTLAEHLRDGRTFHTNIYRLLSKHGIAFHFFSTLYAPPFVVNRLLPEKIASLLLDRFSSRDRYRQEKFPAFYSWCRGPTPRQMAQFIDTGYDILEYRGFFGHEGYYNKVPALQSFSANIAEFLLRHPCPYLTSYAYVLLRKPDSGRQRCLSSE